MEFPRFGKSDLFSETRWSREYRSPDGAVRRIQSRFLDGSATITLAEVMAEWPEWDQRERFDFSIAFCCAINVPDRDDILRFLVRNGDENVRSVIAANVATFLPREEAAPILKEWCLSGKIGRCASYFQALALANVPDGLDLLRKCFSTIWNTPGVMEDTKLGKVAFDAVCCLKQMIMLGENIDGLRSAYGMLKTHPCAPVRRHTERWLSEYFEGKAEI